MKEASFGKRKKLKKIEKEVKKGVNSGEGVWYYNRAPEREGRKWQGNLPDTTNSRGTQGP